MSSRSFLELDDSALLAQCEETHLRGGGPGGQKRNKTSSAVRLVHRSTGIQVTASDDRSQRVNKIHALGRLREAIALKLRAPIDLATYKPSSLLRDVLADGGHLPRASGARFWVVASEVLDVLEAAKGALGPTAAVLGVSTGVLNRVLQSDPHVWQRVAELRAVHGRAPLRIG